MCVYIYVCVYMEIIFIYDKICLFQFVGFREYYTHKGYKLKSYNLEFKKSDLAQ